MLTMLLLEHMIKSYNWNTLKGNSAFDVLMHLYVCILAKLFGQIYIFYCIQIQNSNRNDVPYLQYLYHRLFHCFVFY